MKNTFLDTFKENTHKVVEKTGEVKGNFENKGISEYREIAENSKKIIQEPDIESARNFSLTSILEKNKEKRENKEIEVLDEMREGLTSGEKSEIRKLTGWSNEILDSIGTLEEARIYQNANLIETEINGKKCLIRDDVDINQEDEDGITNRERLERGRPPITESGSEVELHHIGQKQNSPLAELTMEQHRGLGNDAILHDKTKETEIDRNEFAKERREHWRDRLEKIEGEKIDV